MRRNLSPRFVGGIVLLLGLPWLLSCSTLGYYGQAAWGQTRILLARRDAAKLAADPGTPAELRRQLAAVLDIRELAVTELGLPDNGSFRSYVELPPAADGSRRQAVVWNVVAAPELDLTPITWCFPVAGCVAYRGYFSERRARRFADRLARRGHDVDVAGAAAYSTLGWFKDPVLSTVIDYPEIYLAGLIFHELAHQLVYVKDDSRFNESFATVVELEGVRRWAAVRGAAAGELEGYLADKRRQRDFVDLALDTRDRLQATYLGPGDDRWKRRRKQEILAELESAYRTLAASWTDDERARQDRWFERELNNARLVSIATYHDRVPAFEALLAEHGGSLPAFYEAVRELAALPSAEREERLSQLPEASRHLFRKVRTVQ